jgi:sodium-dependent dicarboxylate transporter 2/3/5
METIKVPEKIGRKEIYVLIILAGMLALWILSSWIREIDIFTVALLGCCLFFLPGINVLTWKEFIDGISWDVIFITGTVLSTANALVNNGVSTWLVETVYPANLVLGQGMLISLAALTAFALLLVITSAPALITVLAGPFVTIAVASGCPPALLIITLAFCACNCYLFPLDTVQLMTYSKGYYKMTDMPKATIFLQAAMVVILGLWIPFIARIINLGTV